MSEKEAQDHPVTALDFKELIVREQEAMEFIKGNYPNHLATIDGSLQLLSDVTFAYLQDYPAPKTSITIFGRLFNDLRWIRDCFVRGYGAQACTLTASVYEISASVTHLIQCGEASFEKWEGHENIKRPFLTAKQCAEAIADLIVSADPDRTDFGEPAERRQRLIDREYHVYTSVCFYKHGKPQYFRLANAAPIGYDLTEWGQKALCFAAEHSTRLINHCITAWACKYLSGVQQEELIKKIVSNSDDCMELISQSNNRWEKES